jgi:hypothetical protein
VATTLVCFLPFAHGAAGAAGTRRSARPLTRRANGPTHTSGASRREIAKPYLERLEFDLSRGCLTFESDIGATVATPNLTGVVPPAGPKPLRRGEGPVIHIFSSLSANKNADPNTWSGVLCAFARPWPRSGSLKARIRQSCGFGTNRAKHLEAVCGNLQGDSGMPLSH